jgi:hypothetical protein
MDEDATKTRVERRARMLCAARHEKQKTEPSIKASFQDYKRRMPTDDKSKSSAIAA